MQYLLSYQGAEAKAQTLGAELISYRDRSGTEYVWEGDACFWSSHAPVLFPIVGALKNDTVTFSGEPYAMPKHGIVRKREWEFVNKTQNSITFKICSDAETKKHFPYDFSLFVTHTISENGFSTRYLVENTGNSALSVCIGGHAGFRCPLHDGETFEDYVISFERNESCKPLYTDSAGILHQNQRKDVLETKNFTSVLPLKYADFDNDVLVFDNLNSRSLLFQNKKGENGFRFSFDGFHNLGIWTPPHKNAPFICLEPWKGLPAWDDETGAFEDKPDIVCMDPHGMFTAWYNIELL